MSRNIEIKARVGDADRLVRRIAALGATGPEHLVQSDTFFDVPAGRLKLREFGDGSAELIYYQRPDAPGPKLSDYIRTRSAEPETLRALLTRAFGIRGIVVKRRDVFLAGQTRIHVDDVDGLGSFLELEVVLGEQQTAADGERIAAALMTALGVADADLIRHAYIDLLAGPPKGQPDFV